MKLTYFLATYINVARARALPYNCPMPMKLTTEQRNAAAEIFSVAWPSWGDLEIKQPK